MKTRQSKPKQKQPGLFFIPYIFTIVLIFQACSGPLPEESPSNNLDRLVRGKIAHYIPDQMKVGDDYRAIASVTKAMNDSILLAGLASEQMETEEIWVSSRVKIVLFAPTGKNNFEINPLNTEEQTVNERENTIWEWNVKPIKSGQNPLVMRATVKVLDEFGENYRDIPVFEKRVKVKASPLASLAMFLANYWQWVATVIAIPLVTYLYRSIKNRKKQKNE
jgi:hypothetical protein